jgi:Membrane domain of glycerophosphoryl diester phosphodiesterase
MQSPLFRAGPLSVGDLLDWAVRLYRARFGKLILTTAIFLVPLGLISSLISGQTMTSYLNIFMAAMQDPESLADQQQLIREIQANNPWLSLSYLLMPLGIAANGLVTLALAYQSIGAIHNREVEIGESIRLALRRFWPWLGMTFAIYAAFIGVGILVLIAIFILFFFGALVAGSFMAFCSLDSVGEAGFAGFAGMMVGIFCLYIGGILLIAGPFVYLSTRWAVAMPLIIDQALGPLEALGESWQLTKGQVRRSMGYMVLLYLFYGIIYGAFMAIAFAGAGLALTSSTLASVAIFGVVGALVPVLWQPLAVAAYVMLYYDLRMRNQGYDLELRIQQLETEVERAAHP